MMSPTPRYSTSSSNRRSAPAACPFVVESVDRYGHVISTPGTAILSVPGPALAAGFLGLSSLVAGGAALSLRKRLAAR